MSLAYIMTPYSHPNSSVVYYRVRQMAQFCGMLAELNQPYVCTPLMCHITACECKLSGSANFWTFLNDELMSKADFFILLMLKDFDVSVGVMSELSLIHKLGKNQERMDL